MVICPYTFNKEWITSNKKTVLRVSAIDSDGSIIESIEGSVSLDGLDLPEYARLHGGHIKEDIENAVEEALIVRLKHAGMF